jgi:hypothetical protein
VKPIFALQKVFFFAPKELRYMIFLYSLGSVPDTPVRMGSLDCP